MFVTSMKVALCNPMNYTVHGIFQERILEWVVFSFSRDLPNAGIKQAEPQGKPKNTGVGGLSLFQRIFPTQESNQGLLHCRRILYQLNYLGSPIFLLTLQITYNKPCTLYFFKISNIAILKLV